MNIILKLRGLIFFLFAFYVTSCTPKKVWYQEDIQDSMLKTDLQACRSDTGDEKELSLCMRGKGYLQIPQPQAELLAVRSLHEEGLDADEIADRLQWRKKKVLRYLDEDYQLPPTASLGRQPVEISTKVGKSAVSLL